MGIYRTLTYPRGCKFLAFLVYIYTVWLNAGHFSAITQLGKVGFVGWTVTPIYRVTAELLSRCRRYSL